jgi:aryl-alcohol dehydrogenase-like predicted oxidoreductase
VKQKRSSVGNFIDTADSHQFGKSEERVEAHFADGMTPMEENVRARNIPVA